MENKVLMLVRNGVTRDARVLKEAAAVSSNGYKVTLVGIKDGIYNASEEVVDEYLTIRRAPFRSLAYKVKFMLALLGFVVLLFVLFKYGDEAAAKAIFLVIVACFACLKLNRLYSAYLSVLKKEESWDDGGGAVESASRGGSQKMGFFKQTLSAFHSAANKIMSPISQLYKQGVAIFVYGLYVNKVYKGDTARLVHCHDINTLPIGVYLKLRYGCVLVYDAHEFYEDAVGIGKGLSIFYRMINKFSQGFIDGFITINKSFFDIYTTRYPKLPDPVLVMNATRKFPEVDYDGRLHEAAGLPLDKKILLFQGGFSPFRGIERLLGAAEYLDDSWCLVFMGWGKLEALILGYQERIPEKVRVIGPASQSELVYWTSGAYVGVIPYEDHGINHKYCTPNKLWEYPNAGVPIIASPRVELKRIIEENDTGWIYDESLSEEAFAKFIMSVEKDRDAKAKSCKTFIDNNSWSIYENNIVDLYYSLLSADKDSEAVKT